MIEILKDETIIIIMMMSKIMQIGKICERRKASKKKKVIYNKSPITIQPILVWSNKFDNQKKITDGSCGDNEPRNVQVMNEQLAHPEQTNDGTHRSNDSDT